MTIPPVATAIQPAALKPSAPAAPTALARTAATEDTALWQVLSDEERAFFLDAAARPLGYGATGAPNAPAAAPLGQHLDVRG